MYSPIKDVGIDEGQFKTWLKKKEDLNKNIEEVCAKYGKTLNHIGALKSAGLMYDAEHNLLFTHNAKVKKMSILFPNPKSKGPGMPIKCAGKLLHKHPLVVSQLHNLTASLSFHHQYVFRLEQPPG